jgi:hypothetical protein
MPTHFFAKLASAPAATAAFVVWGLLGVATPAPAEVQTAVEYGFYSYWDDCYYYNTNNGWTLVCDYGSYFVTSSPDEIAALDGGAFDLFGGQFAWQRTGETFDVWSGPESGALPTCRFFKPAFYPEHVYTPYEAECAAMQANPDWQYKNVCLRVRAIVHHAINALGASIGSKLAAKGRRPCIATFDL